jgi:excisionase family DNA binding protein
VQITDTTQPERYLSARQLCERLGVDLSTLYRWRKRKLFPDGVKIGGRRLFPMAEVDAHMASLSKPPKCEDDDYEASR